ncbi:MAG: hypothetical protein L6R39_006078 [Caloplaca ligustica]|nr:MAG: hypothetical protein L6R39_006078 [Caloplaca ligustica]
MAPNNSGQAGKKRKQETTTSRPEQPAPHPGIRIPGASSRLLPIEAAVPQNVSHLLQHPPTTATILRLPVYIPQWCRFPQRAQVLMADRELALQKRFWSRDPGHRLAVTANNHGDPYTPHKASRLAMIDPNATASQLFWNHINLDTAMTVMALQFETSAEAIYWARAHNNAIHPPHPSEGVTLHLDDPPPNGMAPATFQAPVSDSLAAYAHDQLPAAPAAPATSNIQAIPPQHLMPWFNPGHVHPRTLPGPPPLRLIIPRLALNRNSMVVLHGNLNAVFPLPEPSLHRYQLPSQANTNPPGAPARQPSTSSNSLPVRLDHDNLMRQINTYHNFGFTWDEIVEKLKMLGATHYWNTAMVRRLWENSQRYEAYQLTEVVEEKVETVEPGDFVATNMYAKESR